MAEVDGIDEARRRIEKVIAKGSQSLDLSGLDITSLEPVADELALATFVSELDLENNPITNIAPIAGMTEITWLDLSSTQVTDISPISEMTDISTLILSQTPIKDLAPIARLGQIGRLILEGSEVADIAALKGMNWLRILDIGHTQITDFEPIRYLSSLEDLSLAGTKFLDTRILSGLVHLESLVLDRTLVEDVEPISGLVNLRKLWLDETPVLDLRPLLNMQALAQNPYGLGLTFVDSMACRSDVSIERISQIEDEEERAKQLFAYLENWLPPGKEKKPSSQPNRKFFFASYARDDAQHVGPLKEYLSDGSGPFWWDQDIPAGAEWRETVATQLADATAVVTFWTNTSTKSKAVREEASKAQAAKRLIHVRLDDAELPFGFGETQYIDLRDWDGSATHPEMRKLLQALNDRLDSPSIETVAARLNRASPVAFIARDKKLSPVDTPPNTQPTINNPRDLHERLKGLRQTLDGLCTKVEDRENYQFPQDLHHCLRNYQNAIAPDKPNWYGLSECRDELNDCMIEHDAAGSWNTVTYKQVVRFQSGVTALQPLLQPRQIPADQPDAKPPLVEPEVHETDIKDVNELASQVEIELQSEEARQTLDAHSLALFEKMISRIRDAAAEMDPEGTKRFKRIRRGLKGLAFATGGVIAAVGGGIMVNVLTAPEAAVTLATRLTPIFERILAFFM